MTQREPQAIADINLPAVRDELERVVAEAGEAILAVLRRGKFRVSSKGADGPVTEADHAADDVLHERLLGVLPDAHWISEESEQEAPLIHGEPTWVIDPLDGTREFLRGLPEYGVSVGLFIADQLVLGAVCLPVSGTVLSGLIDGERREARRDGAPLPSVAVDGAVHRVVISRWDYEHRQIDMQLPFDVYPSGSAAVKLVHAATGEASVYLSTGPRSLWDIAGGTAILIAAGGTVLGVDGTPLTLTPQRVRVPPYLAGSDAACRTVLNRIHFVPGR